ncbi:F-box/kelch-repeat protein At3g06240-like [Cornus florida]|uniref:F-box/kelch-repeat protein At3g06240-like n=1 Tax=Cornus florida TaxID=4283 RepID=UPI00289BF4B6|nr:F-box/kelch-repeat protein At3g06240-like [Cornus florida]
MKCSRLPNMNRSRRNRGKAMKMKMKMKMAAESKRRNQEPCEAMPRAPYLTQHLIVEILSKLPVKALLRFKCVSKRWRSLISDPHFIKAHLNQSLTTNSNIQTQRILVATPFCPLRVYTVSIGGSSDNDDDIDVAVSKIDFLFKNINNPSTHHAWEIIGSCHGLICMVNEFGLICVFNPSTRESKLIRDCGDHPRGGVVGFAYDHCSDDYKLLKISRCNGVYVYSLRNCSCWRKIHDFTKYSVISKGTQLNGAIHWVCLEGSDDKPSEIAVFRLEDEKLWTIPLPAAASITSFNDAVELGVFDGCLCIVACGADNAFCWVMREYGVNQSWAKLDIKLPYYFHILQPLATLRRRNDEEEDMCLIDFEKFVLYNTREGTSRDLLIADGAPFVNANAISYVDTLLSPLMNHVIIT